MFDFGTANDAQREAIRTTDGPLLIIAGPGTGKTYTLIQRAIFMIQEKGVRPENLFLATFTEKAAKELLTRLTDEIRKALEELPNKMALLGHNDYDEFCEKLFSQLKKKQADSN